MERQDSPAPDPFRDSRTARPDLGGASAGAALGEGESGAPGYGYCQLRLRIGGAHSRLGRTRCGARVAWGPCGAGYRDGNRGTARDAAPTARLT